MSLRKARPEMPGQPADWFTTEIARQVWATKYRLHPAGGQAEADIEATWRRVARAVAAVEGEGAKNWEGRFYRELQGFRFLPGGRILAGAGSGRRLTLFNCFVMGSIEDSLPGIFQALEEGALTMQQGGGVGYDFSTLRPRGTPALSTGGLASGPVSFMAIWDSMCATLMSTGARRGAMMATLRCDHPDIEDFIAAKADPRALRHFNLSVLVTDALIQAVRDDGDWLLVFPADAWGEAEGELVSRTWPGREGEVPCRVVRRLPARRLWRKLLRASYDYAEPGVLFIDRINQLNNLGYCERIQATNPCGEIPLPAYGACNLGSINLTAFVQDPFTPQARLDWADLQSCVGVAVRFLDDVIDLSAFPLPQQQAQARASRRIGLGITGLADTLILLSLGYGTQAARELAAAVMKALCHGAYRTSVALARERGPFPAFRAGPYLEAPLVQRLPPDIRAGIAAWGIRNSHLTAIAPAGTISLLANNVSSGIEPIFRLSYRRRLLLSSGDLAETTLTGYAVELWRRLHGDAPWPSVFITAAELRPEDHIAMQADLQPWVDNAISKTINVPEDSNFDDFAAVYDQAYAAGLKGCTLFRPNPVTGAILEEEPTSAGACCGPEHLGVC